MELVKELKTIREQQAESDCTAFASVKKQGCFKILGRKKGKKPQVIMGLVISSHRV